MCCCGCSIISSLMKRLGRTACCSDLFPSHTSEQLQRLAAGCAPRPKVNDTDASLAPPRLTLPQIPSPALASRPARHGFAMRGMCVAGEHRRGLIRPLPLKTNNPPLTARVAVVIDALIQPGDSTAALLP